MKTYKIKVKLEEKEFETEFEGESWDAVCDYVFGNLEIIDLDEE